MRLSAILIWIVLQLLALALAAARVPLWAHHPLPRESLATAEVAAVQIISCALLFSLLLPNFFTSCAIIALAIPFIQLAGMLADDPVTNLLLASALVALWLAGLALLSAALRSPRAQALGVAIVSMLCLGTPLLSYLHSEATPGATSMLSTWSPGLWLVAAIPLAIGIGLKATRRRLRLFSAINPALD
jgi:hypothetical protein